MATMTSLGPDDRPPNWCHLHRCEHTPAQWSRLCDPPDGHDQFAARWRRFSEAWDTADQEDRARRGWLARELKWWTVCLWKHRFRRLGDGMYVTNSCWACTGRAR
jgi:hypothetical protein